MNTSSKLPLKKLLGEEASYAPKTKFVVVLVIDSPVPVLSCDPFMYQYQVPPSLTKQACTLSVVLVNAVVVTRFGPDPFQNANLFCRSASPCSTGKYFWV